jgi:hypothetical protein
MTSTTAIDLLIGSLMPLLIALINQAHWSVKLRALVAIAVCVAAALITELFRDGTAFQLAHWRTTAIYVAGAALASYQLWWRPSTWAPSLESATTLSNPGPASTT